MKKANFYPSLLILLSVGCHEPQRTDTTLSEASDPIPVRVLPIQSTRVSADVQATGLLSTQNETRYSFKIGGVIDRIYVEEGQSVRRGQRLATLKQTEIGAQNEQAQLGLEKARRDYQRTASLYRDSVATLEQFQNAKTAFDLAQRSLQVVSFNQQYAHIVAGASGLVTRKLANEGEIISTGSPVLVINETAGPGDWTLNVGLNDQEWVRVAVGNPATVRIDAFPGRTITGRVVRKPTAADPGSGTFSVEIALSLAGVKPVIHPSVGMFGKARIQTGRSSSHPTIPYEALVEADGNQAFVFTPVGSNRVRRVPIQIDAFNPRQVVVKGGLDSIASIVVANSAFLNEQSIIRIIR